MSFSKLKLKEFLTLLSFMISICVFSQSDTVFFNSAWEKTTRSGAMYYRISTKQTEGFLVKDVYMSNNKPQMIAFCSSLDPLIKNGKCSFYHVSGLKTSQGNFKDNKKTGVWVAYYDGGRDSAVTEFDDLGGEFIIKLPYTYNINSLEDQDRKSLKMGEVVNGANGLVEKMPSFKGGEAAMMKFIRKNINYPELERNAGISGTCYITFVVEKDGKITNARILRGVPNGPGCDKEALRVVNKMPKWKPGMQNGKPVRVQFNLPIKYTLKSKTGN
jgi:TonB family protein